MVSVVLCVRHDLIRKKRGHVILPLDHEIDKSIEQARRQKQIAMIGENRGLAEQSAAKRDAGRIELRQMQLHHIMVGDQFRRGPAKGRCDDALAQPEHHRHADDLHAIHIFFARQGRIILRGHHRYLVSAPDESARQPFRINGQTGRVRPIIGEDGQDSHKAQGLYPTEINKMAAASDYVRATSWILSVN